MSTETAPSPVIFPGAIGARAAQVRRWGPFVFDVLLLLALTSTVRFFRFGPEGGSADVGFAVVDYWTFSLLVVAVWIMAIAMATGGVVHRLSVHVRLRGVLRGTLATFLLTAVAALVLQSEFSRLFVLLVFPIGAALLVANTIGWAAWSTHGGRGPRTLFVGGPHVHSVVAQMVGEGRMRVAGVAAYGRATTGEEPPRMPLIATGADVALAARSVQADLVVIADLDGAAPDFLQQLAWVLEDEEVDLAVSARVGLVSPSRISVVSFARHPLLTISYPHLSAANQFLKRAFDIMASAALVVLLSPLMVVVALAIRADDGGAVIFRQERVGRRGVPFSMLKFRSMTVNAESLLGDIERQNEGAGPLFKMKADPRVTAVGRWLRASSLDELPQLINVLRGEMSLIGPRPALPREVDAYVDSAHRRLNVRPGITGLWQVSGRSDLAWEEGLRLDLSYVENWSLLGDIIILLRTVVAVAARKGAY